MARSARLRMIFTGRLESHGTGVAVMTDPRLPSTAQKATLELMEFGNAPNSA
jgi:hypothetical protein